MVFIVLPLICTDLNQICVWMHYSNENLEMLWKWTRLNAFLVLKFNVFVSFGTEMWTPEYKTLKKGSILLMLLVFYEHFIKRMKDVVSRG